MASYQELISQKAALDKQAAELEQQIESARRTERASVVNQIKTLMAQHGVTLAELGSRAASPKVAKSTTGRKVAAKYRNPETGDTWSGRGLKPKWLQAALANGKSLQDFAL